mgnify:CR=1 FL=1
MPRASRRCLADVGRDNAVDIVDQLDEAVFLLRTIDMAMSNPHEWGEHNEQTMAVSRSGGHSQAARGAESDLLTRGSSASGLT